MDLDLEAWQETMLEKYYNRSEWPGGNTIEYMGLTNDEVLVSPKVP